MAVLADTLAAVDGCSGTRGRAKAAVQVAGCALGGHRNIGMELPRIPAAVTTFVATIAIGNGNSAERFVRNVVSAEPAGGQKATGVATAALAGHRHLAVVPVAGLPPGSGMTTGAVQRSGHVGRRLASCRAAVVAVCAIGRRGEAAVVHARRWQPAGSLVAAAARCLRLDVRRRFPHGGGTIVATAAGVRCNALVVKLRSGKGHDRVATVTTQLGRKVGRRLDHIGPRKPIALGMTGRALLGRTLEHTGDMTRFTTGVGVHARQRETGLDVVEILHRALGPRQAGQQRQDQGQPNQQSLIHATPFR